MIVWWREITKKKLGGEEKRPHNNDGGINKNTVGEEIQSYKCLDNTNSLKTLRNNEESAGFTLYMGRGLEPYLVDTGGKFRTTQGTQNIHHSLLTLDMSNTS